MVVAYSRTFKRPEKAVKARISDLRVHFKNTFETASAVRGLSLPAAQKYLKDVLEHKRCVPFRRYAGGVGRTAQAKEFRVTKGRWPEKSVKAVLDLLRNAESNAELKTLEPEQLYISHFQVRAVIPCPTSTLTRIGQPRPPSTATNVPCPWPHLPIFELPLPYGSDPDPPRAACQGPRCLDVLPTVECRSIWHSSRSVGKEKPIELRPNKSNTHTKKNKGR